MSLRKRTLLLISLIMSGLIIALYIASQVIVLSSFQDEEAQAAQHDMQRVKQMLASDLEAMQGAALDWANWDDMYDFMADDNQQFRASNLTATTFTDLHINAMLLVRSDSSLLYSDSYDPSTRTLSSLSSGELADLRPGALLGSGTITGVVSLAGSPVLVAATPILPSSGEGTPRGTLIFARYLDATEIQRISSTILASFQLYYVGDSQVPSDVRDALASLHDTQAVQVSARSDRTISGYALFDDVFGQPAFVVRTDKPRTLYANGQRTIFLFLGALVIAGLVFTLAAIFFLERGILSRIARLSRSTKNIGAAGDLSLRVADGGGDELSRLSNEINKMLQALERSQLQLVESERGHRQLMEQASDGILVSYPGGSFLDANTAISVMLGYSPEELRALKINDVIVPNDYSELSPLREKVESGQTALIQVEMLRKDGTTFPAEISANRLSDGRTQGIVRDITERKIYERKLRENATSQSLLLKQLMNAQEAERRRLSMDIHDGPLQMLGVSLMALDRAERRNARGEHDIANRELEYLRSTLLESVSEVRAVLADLSQDTLSTYGLVVAVQSHIGRFAEVTGIHVDFKNTLEHRLLADIELLLYRLLQESLANVRKHAHANSVHVVLDERDTDIVLRVSDDGVGFVVGHAFARHEEGQGIGLRSMLERVEGIGGKLTIESSPGHGTTLTFVVPRPTRTTPLFATQVEHVGA